MDPLSITTGIITLVETGTALSTTLWDLTTSYRSASTDVQELASEIDLVTSLFDSLGASMDRAPAQYSADFQRTTRNLIHKCHSIFAEIEGMLPERVLKGSEASKSERAARAYEKVLWAAFTKERVLKRRGELRRVQHMFSFVETVQRCVERGESGGVAAGKAGGDGSFEGLLQRTDVKAVNGASIAPAMFQATLVLQPAAPPSGRSGLDAGQAGETQTYEATEPVLAQDDFRRLQNLRMSPYFSKSLLDDEPAIEGRTFDLTEDQDQAVNYSENIKVKPPSTATNEPPAEPLSRLDAARDVDNILSRACITRTLGRVARV